MERESLIREFVRGCARETLREVWEDVVDVEVRVRVKVNQSTDPTVLDVMTVMRGLPKVITVKQAGNLTPPDQNGRQIMHALIGFEVTGDADIMSLAKGLLTVPSADMVHVMRFDERPVQKNKEGDPLILHK